MSISIGGAFDALARMAAFAAQAIAALVLALAALALAVIGLVAIILASLARIAADMVRSLSRISAELVKVVLVAALVVVVAWSFVEVWRAYRGDIPALLPAAVATLLPLVYAITFTPIWSGLVFAITAAGLAGIIVPHLHPIALAFLAGGVRAVGVLENLNRHQEERTWKANQRNSS